MEVTVGVFLLLVLMAFICEFIDSSMGMGYGTILTPVMIILGFNPLVVVPAVLLSQAFGGLTASIFHHQFDNASFSADSKHLKIVLIISGFGILATILAAFVSVSISKVILKSYIGLLVLTMGVIILLNRTFSFTWKKIIGLGLLSAFNKGLSGGGFGPVITGGQLLSGQDHKAAIGITTLAEAPICICGFISYMVVRTVKELPEPVLSMPFNIFAKKMFSSQMFQWEIILALLIGSVLVTPFGAFTTRIMDEKKGKYIVGVIITVLGIWTLIKTWV
jgi:uncharacterized membrane protein YfcA